MHLLPVHLELSKLFLSSSFYIAIAFNAKVMIVAADLGAE